MFPSVLGSGTQWQVPSVFPDVLGDALPDLNNIYNSSEYTGFIWCICFQRLWEACVRFWWICLSVIHTGTERAFETRIYTLQLKTRFFLIYPVPVKFGDCNSCFTNLWFQFCFDIPAGMHVNLLPSCTTLFWKKACFLAWLLITAVLIVCTFHGELNKSLYGCFFSFHYMHFLLLFEAIWWLGFCIHEPSSKNKLVVMPDEKSEFMLVLSHLPMIHLNSLLLISLKLL